MKTIDVSKLMTQAGGFEREAIRRFDLLSKINRNNILHRSEALDRLIEVHNSAAAAVFSKTEKISESDNRNRMIAARVSCIADQYPMRVFNDLSAVENFSLRQQFQMARMTDAVQHPLRIFNVLSGLGSALIGKDVKFALPEKSDNDAEVVVFMGHDIAADPRKVAFANFVQDDCKGIAIDIGGKVSDTPATPEQRHSQFRSALRVESVEQAITILTPSAISPRRAAQLGLF